MTQKHNSQHTPRLPQRPTPSMPGGNRMKWASLDKARVWMNLIADDPSYARLIFMTAKEQAEFDRTGLIPPPIRDLPLPRFD